MAKGDDKKTFKQELEEFIKRNTEASKSLKDFNEQSSTAFHLAAEAVKLYASTLKDTVDSTQELNDRLKDSSGDYEKNIDKIRESLGLSKQALAGLTSEIKKQAKAQDEASKAAGFKKTGSGQDGKNNVYEQIAKSSKAAKIGMVALHGAVKMLSGAFKLISFTVTSAIDVISTGISLIGSLAKGIFDFVMDLWEGIFEMSKEMMQQGVEYARAVEEVRDKFGDVSKGVGKAVVDMGNQIFAGGAAGLSGFKLFEDKADALRKMSEMAGAAGAGFELLINQFKGENLNALYAYKQGLGLTNEEFAGLARAAIVTGKPIKEISMDIQKYARALSKEFGGSAQAFKSFSRDIAKARMDVKHFANVATKDLATATAYARSLGLELEKIVGIMDAFDTFDAAAENVAKLSQAFGVNLDVMELMSAKTPAEQLDMLKKAFAAAGKSIETMNRKELSYLSNLVKIDEATIQQAGSSKNQGASLDKVKKSSQSLEHQMLSMGESMKDLMKEIPKIIREFQSESKGFFSAFIEGIGIGIVRSGPFRDMLKDIGKTIIKVRDAGIRLGDAFVKYFPGIQKMMDALGNVMPKIGNLFERWTQTSITFFKNLKEGKPVVEGLIDSLIGDTKKFFKESSKEGESFLDGLTDFLDAAGRIFSELVAKVINSLSTMIAEGLTALMDMLEGKKNPISDMADSLSGSKYGSKIKSSAQKMWTPIRESFSNAIDKLSPVLERLWEKIKKGFDDFLDYMLKKWENFDLLGAIESNPRASFLLTLLGISKLSSVASTISTIGSIVGKGFQTAGPFISTFTQEAFIPAIKSAGQGFVRTISTALAASGPIGIGIAGLAAVITGAFYAGSKSIESLPEKLEENKKFDELIKKANELKAEDPSGKKYQEFLKKQQDIYTKRLVDSKTGVGEAFRKGVTGVDSEYQQGLSARLGELNRLVGESYGTSAEGFLKMAQDHADELMARLQKEAGENDLNLQELGITNVVTLQKTIKDLQKTYLDNMYSDIGTEQGRIARQQSEDARIMLDKILKSSLLTEKFATTGGVDEALEKIGKRVEELNDANKMVADDAINKQKRMLEEQDAKRKKEEEIRNASEREDFLGRLGLGEEGKKIDIASAQERFKEIDTLHQKIMGGGADQLQKKINDMKEKLGSITWTIMEPDKLKQVQEGFDQMRHLAGAFKAIEMVAQNMTAASKAIQTAQSIDATAFSTKLSSFITALSKPLNEGGLSSIITEKFPVIDLINKLKDGVQQVSDGINDIVENITDVQTKNVVKASKDLGTALNNLHQEISLILGKEEKVGKVSLQRMADSLAAKTTMSISSTPLQQHITIQVNMKTSDIEEMIFKDAKSITLQGLNTAWKKSEGDTSPYLYYSPGTRSIVPAPTPAKGK